MGCYGFLSFFIKRELYLIFVKIYYIYLGSIQSMYKNLQSRPLSIFFNMVS